MKAMRKRVRASGHSPEGKSSSSSSLLVFLGVGAALVLLVVLFASGGPSGLSSDFDVQGEASKRTDQEKSRLRAQGIELTPSQAKDLEERMELEVKHEKELVLQIRRLADEEGGYTAEDRKDAFAMIVQKDAGGAHLRLYSDEEVKGVLAWARQRGQGPR